MLAAQALLECLLPPVNCYYGSAKQSFQSSFRTQFAEMVSVMPTSNQQLAVSDGNPLDMRMHHSASC